MDTPKTHDDRPRAAAVVTPLPSLIDAAAILALADIQHRWVDVPEWGVRAYVVSLTGAERDDFEAALLESKRSANGKKVTKEVNLRNLRAKLVAASVRDPESESRRIFSDAQVDALGKKNAAALQRLFKAAQELSGLSDDEVDDLTDELGNDQSAGSGSD